MVMQGWWRLLAAPFYLGYSLLAVLPALLMGFREFVIKLATECCQLPRSRPPPDPDSTQHFRFGSLYWSCLLRIQFLWSHAIFPSLFSYALLCWMTMISANIVQGNFGFWCAWLMQLPILALLVGIWQKPLVHWSEFLLSQLLPQRGSRPVSSVPCLYGGRWYIPHRRRCRRGESSIRMPRIYTMPYPPSFGMLFLLVLLWSVCFIGSVRRRLGTVFAWFGNFLPPWTQLSPFLSSSPVPWRHHWPISSVEEFLGFSSLSFRVKLVDDDDFDLEEFIEGSSDPISYELMDSLDDLFFGRLDLAPSLFDLCKAGYHFTFGWAVTENVSWGNWRHRRTIKRQFEKLESRANSPLVPPPPTTPSPSAASRLAQFVGSFNPAAAAKTAFSDLMYSVVPHNITGRFDLRYSKTQLLWKTVLFACAFNVRLPDACPIIFDSGASTHVTPFIEDFVPSTYRPCNISVKGLTGQAQFLGQGIIRWRVRDSSGQLRVLEVPGYHFASPDNSGVRLLSPQLLTQNGNGSFHSNDGCSLDICLKGGFTLRGTIDPKGTNLPQLPLATSSDIQHCSTVGLDTLDFPRDQSSFVFGYNVLDDNNANLTPSQKELLLWHQRLSHADIKQVQSLLQSRDRLKASAPDDGDNALHSGPILPAVNDAVTRCDVSKVKCAACLLAKAKRRTPDSTQGYKSKNPGDMLLKRNHLRPGQCLSCDHYVSPEKGRRVDGYGKRTKFDGYVGGAIYVDHASAKIFHHPQSSLSAADTLRGKQIIEQEAHDLGIKIESYHSDNGIFAQKEFKNHCEQQKQTLSYCGVGAHHQNGIAEINIRTVCNLARANLIHLLLMWPEKCNINLWALSINYAVWIFNRLPKDSLGGLSPNEMWSGVRSTHSDLRRAHVFGCPVYVLDPRLQNGDQIPRWDSRARVGMFVGFSTDHSSLVPLVLNTRTGNISPQYHVIFDDRFETVASSQDHTSIDNVFASLFESSREYYLEVDNESDSDTPLELDPAPSLSSDWIPASSLTVPEGDSAAPPTQVSEGAPHQVSEGASESSANNKFNLDDFDEPEPENASENNGRYPTRSTRAVNPIYTLVPLGLTASALSSIQPPSSFATSLKGPTSFHPRAQIRKSELVEKSLLNASWENEHSAFLAGISGPSFTLPWNEDDNSSIKNPQLARINSLLTPDLSSLDDPDEPIISVAEPHALSAKTRSNPEDNPTYDEAMRGPHADEYYEACRTELKTLVDELDCWELVLRTPDMNVLPSTWAFKCKRYPDGRIKKFKARFCARGDLQVEGVDYFETWSPVAQWVTVRLMMILSVILRLKTAQADITAAFVHAELPPEEQVFIHQPRGFKVHCDEGELVLRLKRSLYGLKQSPCHFYQYLSSNLEDLGLVKSNFDPCLFIGTHVIVVVYVDDCLLYAKEDKYIEDLLVKLRERKVQINREGSAEGFLGVDVSYSDTDSITLTQEGLAKRIIAALGLDGSYSRSTDTPAETAPLPKDASGTPANPLVNYASIVGMLLYLSGHSRPDIAFAVHQCARYTFKPTCRHFTALKRIGRYLKGTANKGLILCPSKYLHVDCFPDADFAGLYNHEDSQDPHCVRSRTGYVILVAGCPVLWKSKLQTEIALSTMEAEYVALSQACKDLFPLLDMVKELSNAVGVPVDEDTNMHVQVHEDNVGALTLGRLEPKRMTPRSKHYAIKYHWFREQIGPRNIKLVKVETRDQLGDIFTKGLGGVPFRHLRLKLMGW